MDIQFKIKSIALQLITHVYLNCDCSLKVKGLECNSLLHENVTTTDISMAYAYLVKKKFIIEKGVVATSDITCELTAEGIDWVEECNGVKLY